MATSYEPCEKCGIDKPVGFECPWCAIKTLEAERDRYREALEKIAADSVVAPGYVRRWITLDDAQDIASEALNHDR